MANEKRLIDANVAMDSIIDQLEIEWGYEGIREDVKRIFEDAPTVDAVEVMRCGQCVFSDLSMSVPCAYVCRNQKSPCRNRVTCADFGCLYGERREGE